MEDQPFALLPEALVDDLLNRCGTVSEGLFNSFNKIREEKTAIRTKLVGGNLIHRDTEISSVPANPTSCGVDGSYAIERLLSTDLVAVAAVAVEGLTPPSEKRYWPQPQHFCDVKSSPHNESTATVLRAVTMCMEIELASNAPHDVVMLDGSLTTPLIYINQGLSEINNVPDAIAELLRSRVEKAINSMLMIIESKRSDRIYAALPKYSTRKEVTEILGLTDYEDRGLLSFILNAGEYVGPIQRPVFSDPWYVGRFLHQPNFLDDYKQKISEINVIYYRPFDHLPTLRIEVSSSIARNPQRLSVLFEAMRIQCGAPSIFEPYPLFMADRMVKHLSAAIPALRRTTTQFLVERWPDEIGSAFLAMHGYRTDSG
ncbi:MAG: DNA double-strand break repair nuclease NurA [Candidatus Bathyarchaeota archaeon]|nr:DNA double-strand break repair nuclease NurA [Candidatus Bathyarchaeota archaeon]